MLLGKSSFDNLYKRLNNKRKRSGLITANNYALDYNISLKFCNACKTNTPYLETIDKCLCPYCDTNFKIKNN